jgi:hypothetical protein
VLIIIEVSIVFISANILDFVFGSKNLNAQATAIIFK